MQTNKGQENESDEGVRVRYDEAQSRWVVEVEGPAEELGEWEWYEMVNVRGTKDEVEAVAERLRDVERWRREQQS